MERNSNMMFTFDFHIINDSTGLPEQVGVCVCVFSVLGDRIDSYRMTLLGACLDNIMGSHFHG